MNDVRGDANTARPRVLEDLSAWSSVLSKFDGEAIGSDLLATSGSAWGAYQAVTEYITHESGKAKNPVEAARKRMESIYWGSSAQAIAMAHTAALEIM